MPGPQGPEAVLQGSQRGFPCLRLTSCASGPRTCAREKCHLDFSYGQFSRLDLTDVDCVFLTARRHVADACRPAAQPRNDSLALLPEAACERHQKDEVAARRPRQLEAVKNQLARKLQLVRCGLAFSSSRSEGRGTAPGERTGWCRLGGCFHTLALSLSLSLSLSLALHGRLRACSSELFSSRLGPSPSTKPPTRHAQNEAL